MRLFDCYTMIGVSTKPPFVPALTAEDLLAEMDWCGVDEALVHSDAGQISSALVTNRQVAELCVPHERLHPVWSILPSQTGEMDPKTLISDMTEHAVSFLRADPDGDRFLLNEITFGPLFEEMIRCRIPLFLPSSWPVVTQLLIEFPRLTVVVVNHGCWGADRYFRPLLERFENFYVDLSSYELDGGLSALVEKYGPRRILFGSGYHRRPMGGATLMLRNADISEEAKTLIAHGNMTRLLKEVQP